MRVLVVDDDPVVLASCRRVLENEGHEYRVFSGALEALEALKVECFDLLLVDIKMPEQDGIYLMEQAKGVCPDVPILVMSGYPTSETIERSQAIGAKHFISKPFTPDELVEAMAKVVQGGEP